MMDTNKVTALATAATALIAGVAVLVAVYQLRLQSRLTRYTAGLDTLWKLDATWDAPEMQRTRRGAAKAIAEKQESADVDGVLDFFELLGLLVRRQVLDEELAWHGFYHPLSKYWRLTRDYAERVRRDDPAVWEDLIDLVRRLDAVEAQRSHRPATAIVPTPDELKEFLEDEQGVGLDQQPSKPAPSAPSPDRSPDPSTP